MISLGFVQVYSIITLMTRYLAQTVQRVCIERLGYTSAMAYCVSVFTGGSTLDSMSRSPQHIVIGNKYGTVISVLERN